MVAKAGFFKFLCFKLNIRIFRGLLKHYKNRGFNIFCVFVVEREANGKIDNWNFWFWVFCPKMAVSWRTSVFQKNLLKPLFYCVFGCALFGPSCQKRKFWTPTKKGKNWLLTETHFWVFFVFFGGEGGCFFCCFFLEGLRVRWGGPKGHLTWPQTLLIFVFVIFFCIFFGGGGLWRV